MKLTFSKQKKRAKGEMMDALTVNELVIGIRVSVPLEKQALVTELLFGRGDQTALSGVYHQSQGNRTDGRLEDGQGMRREIA